MRNANKSPPSALQVVYHKHGTQMHTFRLAGEGDDPVENHSGDWLPADLISWRGISVTIRAVLAAHSSGSATLAIKNNIMANANRIGALQPLRRLPRSSKLHHNPLPIQVRLNSS